MFAKRFLLPLLLLICSTFAFSACGGEGIPLSITDFEGYKDMTQEGTDSITVKYDNATGGYFTFTIDDEDEIAAVMEIIFTATFTDSGSGAIPPGDNSYIIINQGERQYGLSVRYVKRGNTRYYIGNALQSKLYELAVSAGAYENR